MEIGDASCVSWIDYNGNVDRMVDIQMMQLGGGVITDLERFVLGPNSGCTINGHEIVGNAVDYFGGSVYDDDLPY